jgi:hypothetical protein
MLYGLRVFFWVSSGGSAAGRGLPHYYISIGSFVLCVTCFRTIAMLGRCSIDALVTIPIAYQKFMSKGSGIQQGHHARVVRLFINLFPGGYGNHARREPQNILKKTGDAMFRTRSR